MKIGDLCTVADVQSFLSIPTGTDDALIGSLISACSDFIAQYCSRNFYVTVYNDILNGSGNQRQQLRNQPIVSIDSVTVGSMPVSQSQAYNQRGWFNDSLAVYYRQGGFCKGFQNVFVTYTAGFATPIGSPMTDAAGIPPAIRETCVEMVATKYKRRTTLEKSGESAQGFSISFARLDAVGPQLSTLGLYRVATVPVL